MKKLLKRFIRWWFRNSPPVVYRLRDCIDCGFPYSEKWICACDIEIIFYLLEFGNEEKRI